MTKVVDRTGHRDAGAKTTARAKPLKPTDAPRAANAPCKCGCGLTFVQKSLCVGSVQIEPELQMRVVLDDAAIREYADHYRRAMDDKLMDGEKPYDLVEVVEVAGGRRVVAHGFHRRNGMAAARMLDAAWDFLVAKGTIEQAAKHAARANRAAGSVRYTSLDKENACKKLWSILGNVSQRMIGKLAGVSPATAKKHQPSELADQPVKGEDEKLRKPKKKGKPGSTVQTGQLNDDGNQSPTSHAAGPESKQGGAAPPVPGRTDPAAAPPPPRNGTVADQPAGVSTEPLAEAPNGTPANSPLRDATVAGRPDTARADGAGEPVIFQKSVTGGVGGGPAGSTDPQSSPVDRAQEGAPPRPVPTARPAVSGRTWRHPDAPTWFAWIVEGGAVVGIQELPPGERIVSTPIDVGPPTAVPVAGASPAVEAPPARSPAATPTATVTGRGKKADLTPMENASLREQAWALLRRTKQPQRALVKGGVFESDQAASMFLKGTRNLSRDRATLLEDFLAGAAT